MGSANGTKVNGRHPREDQALDDGDKLTLGPVVFVFAAVEAEAEEPSTDAVGRARGGRAREANSTRIVSVDKVKKRVTKGKGEALKPEGVDAEPEDLDRIQRSATRALRAVPALPAHAQRAATGSAPRRGRSSARPLGCLPRPAAPRGASPAARWSVRLLPKGLRGRGAVRRRDVPASSASLGRPRRQLKLFWLQASQACAAASSPSFGLLGLGVVGATYYLVLGKDGGGPGQGDEP